MSFVKTSELIGPALDWAVASIEGDLVETCGKGSTHFNGVRIWINKVQGMYNTFVLKDSRYAEVRKNCEDSPLGRNQQFYLPSTSWAQGGPIIEREKITTIYNGEDGIWNASHPAIRPVKKGWKSGTTPLIAAMRCYVASRLGDEIDVPEELL